MASQCSPERKKGHRFETTSRVANDETMKLWHTVSRRGADERKALKQSIQKTSIVLGKDDLGYETEAQARQRVQSAGSTWQRVDGKAMKKALTATHFVLGSAPVEYTTEATREDPTGRMHEFLAQKCEQDPRKSSCYFGSDDIRYVTTMKDGMIQSFDSAMKVAAELRNHAKVLKHDLSQTNVVFGLHPNEKNFATTSRDTFQYDPAEAHKARGNAAKEVQAELRRQHFSIGYDDKQNYETDAMASMKSGEITDQRLRDMEHDAQAACNLKHKLLATNVVIGDDPLYMS